MQVKAIPTDQCEVQGIHPEAIQAARAALVPDEVLADLAETFSALADSNRMKILFALATTELCVCDLACVVGNSESAISQHLRVLRSLRWVKGRREGRMVYYSLADQHVRSLLHLELEHVRDE
ncbi:MAG TPA: metalloregulator ArsR/SmtB family transcription factor [Dehalococcoidia bacterium]|nr:metalloregulator ArsR/SmtB family transcription factor [Dehalococcoidia bacterium]